MFIFGPGRLNSVLVQQKAIKNALPIGNAVFALENSMIIGIDCFMVFASKIS